MKLIKWNQKKEIEDLKKKLERSEILIYNLLDAYLVEMDKETLKKFLITEIGFTEEEYNRIVRDAYQD